MAASVLARTPKIEREQFQVMLTTLQFVGSVAGIKSYELVTGLRWNMANRIASHPLSSRVVAPFLVRVKARSLAEYS